VIDLDGAVAVVTGGARGIGRATAARLVAAGARVWIGDVDVPAVERTASDLGAQGGWLDVADPDSFGSFLARAEVDGPVKMLVNNAGILRSGSFLDQPLDGHAQEIGVNLMGVVNGMHHVLPPMVERGEGHVVNMASMAAKITTPQMATYCATKFAVAALSRAVRAELAGTGVTISTVMPAAVNTGLVSHFNLGPAIPILDPDEVAQAIVATARHGRPENPLPRWLLGVGVIEQAVPETLLDRVKRAAVHRVTT
jgi:short-subunit dehydrogenase